MHVPTRALRAAFALLLAAGTLAAQETSPASQPQVITSGQAEVRVMPDRATISLGVQTRAVTAADASATNARRQKAVIEAIKARGVPAEEISTAGYSVQPEYKNASPGSAPVVSGYVVSNIVAVRLPRVDLTGAVIDAAIAAGANEVNSLTFAVANPDSARREALRTAVERARGDAEIAARAAGGKLGGLIELMATDYDMPMPRPVMYRARVQAMEVSTPVEAGAQSVTARVTIRWRFLSGQ